jgi:hypothetical protein
MYTKKVEYLKGLMDGLSLDKSTDEFKLFTAVIDALDAFAGAVGDIEEDITDIEDALDGMNDEMDAMSDLMDALSDLDGGEEDNIRQFPGGDLDGGESEYEVTCPGCENVFTVDEDTIFKGNVVCPGCDEKLAFDVSGGCCNHCRDEEPISSDD